MSMLQKVTVIGPTVVVRGKLRSDEDLVIQGRIEAEIASTRLVHVEKEGVVKADLRAASVLVSGLVVGNITAGSRLEVTAEGRVVGNVSTPVLVLQEGARVRGAVEMPEVEAAMAAPRPEPVVQPTTPKKEAVTAPRLEAVPRLEPAPRPGRRTSAPPPDVAAAIDEAAVDAILDSPPLGTQPVTADGSPAAPRQSLATPLTDAEAAAALDIPEIEILDEGIFSISTTRPE
ncbi:MAG TPA: polymer-forming cytoskeletal protein [Kofleriaceae bacterium]|nr:polymer-forming cytoskeletal protein [Kofleriaceae bacterium]